MCNYLVVVNSAVPHTFKGLMITHFNICLPIFKFASTDHHHLPLSLWRPLIGRPQLPRPTGWWSSGRDQEGLPHSERARRKRGAEPTIRTSPYRGPCPGQIASDLMSLLSSN